MARSQFCKYVVWRRFDRIDAHVNWQADVSPLLMMNDSFSTPVKSSSGFWLFAVAVFSVPISVLLHELGHFGAYCAFGFDSPALHYASSGFPGDSEFWSHLQAGEKEQAMKIAGVTQMGIAALLGLLVSYAIVGIGIWIYVRFKFAEGLCFAASSSARFPLVAMLFFFGGKHHDEAHVQQALGIPEVVLLIIGIACTIASTVLATYLLHRQSNAWKILPIIAGVVVGTACWMNGVGAFLIP